MKKALALIVLSTLLVVFTAGIFSIDSVSANFIWPREMPPEGYRIFSDGTFQGQNMHRDDNTYTLTGNVDCPIAIEKDNVVLDGAGYTVQGNGISSITWSEGGSGYSGGGADNSGVWLKERNGVTIKNLTIKNFDYGINFVSDYYSNWKESTNCNIIGNNIINNQFGLSLKSSNEYYIAGNYVANNTRGVFMGSQSTLRNNTFVDNQAHFYNFDRAKGDIDTSNTVDGKPIYYLYDQQHMTVPSNAGLVVLYNCRDIEVKGVSIKNNLHGIYLANTYDSTISGNDITNNINGISLEQCSNNIISGNYVANNTGNGISLSRSEDNKVYNNTVIGNDAGISFLEPNTVSKNVVIANRKDGIDADAYSVITANYVAENLGNGIFLRHINGSTIEGNKVTLNKGCGIGFGYGPDGAVKNNIISKNGLGIWISNAFNNIISENEITENDGYAIRLEGSHHDNLIYRNNFIDNSHKGVQASIPDVWYNPMDNSKYAPPQMHATPKPLTFEGATNRWDNGTEGNYWSDSQSSTYVINPDNQDNHPLLSPINIAATEVPETFPSQRTSTITTGTVSLTNILLATMLLAVIIVSTLLYFKHRKKLVPP